MFFTTYSFLYLCKAAENKWLLQASRRSLRRFYGQPKGFILNFTCLDNTTKTILNDTTCPYAHSLPSLLANSLLVACVEQALTVRLPDLGGEVIKL